MEKAKGITKWKVLYLLLVLVLVGVIIVGDLMVFAKLNDLGVDGSVKQQITIFSSIVILLAVGIGVFMLAFMIC